MKKRYAVREPIPHNAHAELAEFPELMRHLLFHRGIDTRRDAHLFLGGGRSEYDGLLLPDAEKAVSRIERAIQNKERIAVWSDYDTDGIPGGVLLREALLAAGACDVLHVIPHRNTDGFGLNIRMIDELREAKVGLLITVDCGIANSREAAAARERGIEVIITDHHLSPQTGTPNGMLPDAIAIVNPVLGDYPNQNLCGAGVAFKIASLLLSRVAPNAERAWKEDAYALVGLATLSDMVPLTGENRTLAQKGLSALRRTSRPGLTALFRRTGLAQSFLSEDDITFMVSPRLNAASRIDEPEIARDLLSAHNEEEADALAEKLERLNHERRGHVAAIVKDLHHRLSASDVSSVVVVGDPRWQPGLLGLVAHTLVERYKRPAFVWGRGSGELIKGSCRGDGRLSVVSLMEAAKEHFLEYGGHERSGGFSVSSEMIHTLPQALADAHASFTLSPHHAHEPLFADARLALKDACWETFHIIDRLAPFGVGNPKPVFLLEDVYVESVRAFGKGKEHIAFVLSDGDAQRDAIQFFAQDEVQKVSSGTTATLVAALEASHFRGRPELRLRILDVL